ncbi:MAG: translation initiation factor IF-5A [Candidatus Aenigmarchaeota archaeon]|nr:translation initiation factor IF-5A [Candidatus Aenigmarchaeota archaeon]MCX8190647.1 translation initiation factor IF-5A [Candidatus Aenigmarchaeota archaeon]MDW8159814.1 translation initiation factor IF-5A [Candidatus Aenigmarchaeota archaeon]
MAEKTTQVIKNMKPGNYILIDGAPCKVEKVTTSTSGKHGASKTRVDAIGLLDGTRRSIVKPSDEEVEVPILEKKKAQVVAIEGNIAHLLDLQTYQEIQLEIPEDRMGEIKEGEEIEYFEIMDIKTLKLLK